MNRLSPIAWFALGAVSSAACFFLGVSASSQFPSTPGRLVVDDLLVRGKVVCAELAAQKSVWIGNESKGDGPYWLMFAADRGVGLQALTKEGKAYCELQLRDLDGGGDAYIDMKTRGTAQTFGWGEPNNGVFLGIVDRRPVGQQRVVGISLTRDLDRADLRLEGNTAPTWQLKRPWDK